MKDVKICPHCGNMVMNWNKFCAVCGKDSNKPKEDEHEDSKG